jgi:hypothetical protein
VAVSIMIRVGREIAKRSAINRTTLLLDELMSDAIKVEQMVLRFALIILPAVGVACNKPQTAELKLMNGKVIAEEEFPAVFWLGNCTGTFVSDNTLLTAAHCIGSSQTVRINRRINATSTKVLIHPETRRTGRIGAYDIAVAIFPDNTAPATVPVYPQNPASGQEAVFVGYGQSNNGAGAGTKRMGRNKIRDVSGDVIRSRRSTSNAGSGEDVSVAPGDSGGPLFIDGHIAGITSYMNEYYGSGHGDLASAKTREFLREAVEKHGARISFDGNVPQQPRDTPQGQSKMRLSLDAAANTPAGFVRIFIEAAPEIQSISVTNKLSGASVEASHNGAYFTVEIPVVSGSPVELSILGANASGAAIASRKVRLTPR